MTIRERVAAIETEMAGEQTTPERTRIALVQLTGLLGKAAGHLRACELAYKRVLANVACQQDMSAAGARIASEATPEYGAYREAKDVTDSIHQMVVTCRSYLRSIDEEMRLQR